MKFCIVCIYFDEVMPVCPDMSPVLFVYKVGLHLGHCKVHLLSVYEGNAGAESGNMIVMTGVVRV